VRRGAPVSDPPAAPGRRLGRREFFSTAVPLLLVALFAALALWRPPAIEDSLENLLLDWRFKARNALRPPAVPPNIVIVAIDDASIARYGRWPWSRIRIAELIEKIAGASPRAIGVDIFFSEPESSWADQRLAEALASANGKATAALAFSVGAPFTGEVPEVLIDGAIARIEQPTRLRPFKGSQALLPPQNIAAASHLGHANYKPDLNGKLRWEFLYLEYGGEYIPSLALQTARIALQVPPEAVRILGEEGVELDGRLIPTDEHGRMFVNYYGGDGTFPHYSAAAVLSGDTSPAIFQDAVVFIGATGIATYDLIVTPFAESMPGVEKNATVAANILARVFLRNGPLVVDLLVVLLAGAAVFLLCRRRRAALSLFSLVGLTLLLVGANFACFLNGVRLALAYPLALVVVQGAATVAQQYLAEERVARQMRRMFSSYVTERVVDQLIANPEMARLGGERREVTILFSDIRGFTTFSEKHPPEEVVGTLNEYLAAMTEVIFRWEGTVDKFIGDAILAFWSAPLVQEDHAERALRCALHLCGRLDELNAAWSAAGRPTLEFGIGINTGEVLVGNIGAEGKKMDYTVIGDQVNLCSRVEGLTKKYQTRILITASTLERLRPLFENKGFGHLTVQGIETVAVKGKEEAVRVYRVAAAAPGEPTIVEEIGCRDVVHLHEK
jgi:adenylate cyclase